MGTQEVVEDTLDQCVFSSMTKPGYLELFCMGAFGLPCNKRFLRKQRIHLINKFRNTTDYLVEERKHVADQARNKGWRLFQNQTQCPDCVEIQNKYGKKE